MSPAGSRDFSGLKELSDAWRRAGPGLQPGTGKCRGRVGGLIRSERSANDIQGGEPELPAGEGGGCRMQKWAAAVGIFIIAALGLMLVYTASRGYIDFVVIVGFSAVLAVLGVVLMNQRELLRNQRRDREARIRKYNESLRGKDSGSFPE
uniref:hypothetical protein n=1 Tax=Paenibacillus terrae TaxID=159743 RepID=UPI0011A11018|nr:hypothetical protein [Paenibacillus terrae]